MRLFLAVAILCSAFASTAEAGSHRVYADEQYHRERYFGRSLHSDEQFHGIRRPGDRFYRRSY